MGKSFFTGTDHELYLGSDNFATRILTAFATYGLTSAQSTAYQTLNTTWRNAYEVANEPVTRTQSTVAAKNTARAQIKTMSSNLAKIVEGTATVTNQQKLDLGLSVRATPAPVPAPGTPSDFKVVLSVDGSIELKWKCNNPKGAGGTLYQVWRRIGGVGEFTYLGGSGQKRFHDATIPFGSNSVTYQIQAVRSTVVGAWAQYNVNFGVAGEPVVTEETTATKLAA